MAGPNPFSLAAVQGMPTAVNVGTPAAPDGPAAPGPAAPTQSAPPAANPFSLAAVQNMPTAVNVNGTPPDQQAAPGSWGSQLGAGGVKSIHDVTDWPAEKIAAGVGDAVHAFGLAPNWHPGANTVAADQAADAQYQKNYSNSTAAGIGRFLGDVAGSTAEVAGGEGLLGMAGGAIARGAPEVGRIMAPAGRFLSGASEGSPINRLASLGVHGAMEGAAANSLANGSQGPTEQSALTGAMVGGVAAPVAALAGKVYGAVAPRFHAMFGTLADSEPVARKAAVNQFLGRLAKDGVTPDEALDQLRALGPHGLMSDIKARNVRSLAEGLANRPGPGAEMARTALEGRQEQAEDRITQLIQNVTGQKGNTYEAGQDLMQQRSRAAAPLYAQLNDITPSPTQIATLDPYIMSDRGQKALKAGVQSLSDQALARGETFNPANYGLHTDQDGRLFIMPNTHSWPLLQSMKEGFDDLVEGNRDLTTGRLPNTKEVNNLGNIRDSFRTNLTQMFPQYQAALDAWSGPSSAMAAQKMGQNILKNDPDVTSGMIGRMSENEKAFYLNGVARAMLDKVEGNAASASDARGLFRNTSARKKLQAALGPQGNWSDFEKSLENEIQFADAKNDILRGSQTSRREAEREIETEHPGAELIRGLTGDIPGALIGLARKAVKNAPLTNDRADAHLGKILFTPGNADAIAQDIAAARPGAISQLGSGIKQGLRRVPTTGAAVASGAMTRQPKQAQQVQEGIQQGYDWLRPPKGEGGG